MYRYWGALVLIASSDEDHVHLYNDDDVDKQDP